MERSRWDAARSAGAVLMSVVLACAAWFPLAAAVFDDYSWGPLLSLAPFVLVPPAICGLVLLNSPHRGAVRRAALTAYGLIFLVLVVVLAYANSQSS